MRKLRLDLDGIRVESFRTSEAAAWKGTVRGNGEPGELDGFDAEIGDGEVAPPPPPPRTLPPDWTCDTCVRTCETRCTCPTYFGECTCV